MLYPGQLVASPVLVLPVPLDRSAMSIKFRCICPTGSIPGYCLNISHPVHDFTTRILRHARPNVVPCKLCCNAQRALVLYGRVVDTYSLRLTHVLDEFVKLDTHEVTSRPIPMLFDGVIAHHARSTHIAQILNWGLEGHTASGNNLTRV